MKTFSNLFRAVFHSILTSKTSVSKLLLFIDTAYSFLDCVFSKSQTPTWSYQETLFHPTLPSSQQLLLTFKQLYFASNVLTEIPYFTTKEIQFTQQHFFGKLAWLQLWSTNFGYTKLGLISPKKTRFKGNFEIFDMEKLY